MKIRFEFETDSEVLDASLRNLAMLVEKAAGQLLVAMTRPLREGSSKDDAINYLLSRFGQHANNKEEGKGER